MSEATKARVVPVESRIGRLAILLNCGFKEAAMIKDNPEYSSVLREIAKKTFNDYWAVSRMMVKQIYKMNVNNEHADNIEEFTALLYDAIDQIFISHDPVTLLALIHSFNEGEITVTN